MGLSVGRQRLYVRFIYRHSADWYLSIDVEDKRDVIERPINDELDISGWDLRKSLKLLRKSNPPLLEWLSSPIIYREVSGVADRLRAAIDEFYSPVASHHHYLNMARNNHREYLTGEQVRTKKYFYTLRPLLAIRWIEQGIGPVPMEFKKLVDRCITSPELKAVIADLLETKRSGKEIDRQPQIAPLSDYIDAELAALAKSAPPPDATRPDIERLNELFRDVLRQG